MRTYDKVLLIAEPGTGKTLSFLSVLEYARTSGLYRRAYVFEKGPGLLDNVRRELACKATPQGTFDTAAVTSAAASTKRSMLAKAMSPFYIFGTYVSLANIVKGINRAREELRLEGKPNPSYELVLKTARLYTDEEIEREFSGSVFVLDEAHGLIGLAQEKSASYDSFMRVFTRAKRIKVILATATPMINKASEFGPLMNLILPEPLKFSPRFDFKNSTFEAIEAKCRGRISYVRAESTKARIVYRGEPIDEKYLKEDQKKYQTPVVAKSLMSGVQASFYGGSSAKDITKLTRAIDKAGEETSAEDGTSAEDRLLTKAIQAGLFVFPDRSVGGIVGGIGAEVGIAKYVMKSSAESSTLYEFRRDSVAKAAFAEMGVKTKSNFLQDWLVENGTTDFTNLNELSCKFASIINFERSEIKKDGVTFIYSDLKNGGGAIMLGLVMGLFGFTELNYTSLDAQESSASGSGPGGSGVPFCTPSGGGGSKKRRTGGLDKRPRFALMLPDNEKYHESIKAIANSKENYKGEYIRAVVGSRVTRDGLSIFNVTRIHILTPGWTPAGLIQAIYRGIRAVSHDEIYARRLAEIRVKNPTISDEQAAEMAIVDVNVFLHSAVYQEDVVANSADELIFTRSAIKDFEIRHVLNMAKRCSFDCALNYHRNVTIPLSTGTIRNFSQECDFKRCDYVCGSPDTIQAKLPETYDEINFATYDILYSSSLFRDAVKLIVSQIGKTGAAYSGLGDDNIRGAVVFKALNKVINSNTSRPTFRNSQGDRGLMTTSRDGTVFFNPFHFAVNSNTSSFPQSEFETDAAQYAINQPVITPKTLYQAASEVFSANIDAKILSIPDDTENEDLIKYAIITVSSPLKIIDEFESLFAKIDILKTSKLKDLSPTEKVIYNELKPLVGMSLATQPSYPTGFLGNGGGSTQIFSHSAVSIMERDILGDFGGAKEIKSLIRVFDTRSNKWRFVSSENEISGAAVPKTVPKPKVRDDGAGGAADSGGAGGAADSGRGAAASPQRVSGKVTKGGKFSVKVSTDISDKTLSGINFPGGRGCNTIDLDILSQILGSIDPEVTAENIAESEDDQKYRDIINRYLKNIEEPLAIMTRDEIFTAVNKISTAKAFIVGAGYDANKLPEETLKRIFLISKVRKGTICKYLEATLNRKGLVIQN